MLVLSFGAGIYEELVFRLVAFTLLSLMLVDLLEMRKVWAALLMVVMLAVLFSLYHYLGHETFRWQSFAVSHSSRGSILGWCSCSGIWRNCWSHAAYDIMSCYPPLWLTCAVRNYFLRISVTIPYNSPVGHPLRARSPAQAGGTAEPRRERVGF